MGDILVGTSSWTDPGFVEEWYPQDLPARERLRYYSERFPAVELNASFYAVPGEGQAERWAVETPERFCFDVKLHRYLSRHAAKPESLPRDLRAGAEVNERGSLVRDPGLERELARRTVAALEPLAKAGKLGAFVLQLTPGFDPRDHSLEELDDLLAELSPHPVAIEFRHRGWVEERRREETLAALRERGASYVCVDGPRGDHLTMIPPLDAVTSERLAYLRCHGRNAEGFVRGRSVAERFDHDYKKRELEEIAERSRVVADEARETHVMFNNNARDYAPKAAKRFLSMIGE